MTLTLTMEASHYGQYTTKKSVHFTNTLPMVASEQSVRKVYTSFLTVSHSKNYEHCTLTITNIINIIISIAVTRYLYSQPVAVDGRSQAQVINNQHRQMDISVTHYNLISTISRIMH